MNRRIVIEDGTCLHGNEVGRCSSYLGFTSQPCPGGNRRVLTEGDYVPVVRTSVMAQTYAITTDPTEADAYLVPLDALSDHTEGTP